MPVAPIQVAQADEEETTIGFAINHWQMGNVAMVLI